MSQGKEELTFSSFKGLGYVSMFYGMPLMPVLVLSAAGVFGAFVLCHFFGAWGLIWPAVCGMALLVLKVICETDNKAMERARWTFKSWWLRLKLASKIVNVSPNKAGSKDERFFRRLKKIHRSQ
ncbi:hypothetical protein ACN99C_26820 (plasmid) [Pseudomonas alloputida]|uniref:hypothetical protein n=1 Tax=Pseudomonas alloputida TaxID=1940621 RepID=UPI003B434388